MQRSNRWMVVVLVIAALQLSACTQTSDAPSKIEPAKVEPLEGGLNRVVLTEKAAERLDIQMALVRDEQVVRRRTVGGEVVALPEAEVVDLSGVLVRVPLNVSDLNKVDPGQPALVLPLNRDEDGEESDGWMAEAVDDFEETTATLYYVVDSAEHSLVPGQRVLVELSLLGSGTQRKVVPYAAVIYDLHGETWTYTSPEPLIFVRHSISVDYIDGDLAVLSEGPPSGTEVVTVGVAELFGAEQAAAQLPGPTSSPTATNQAATKVPNPTSSPTPTATAQASLTSSQARLTKRYVPAHPDTGRNAYPDADGNTYPDADGNAHPNAHPNADRNAHPDVDSNTSPGRNPYTKTYAKPDRRPPTPAPQPAGAGVQFPAPVLLSPADGQVFSIMDEVTLRWQPVGQLVPDECYVPTVAYLRNGETWYDGMP